VPVPHTVNLPALGIAIVAVLALFRFKIGMIPTLAGCAALGFAYHLGRSLVG
jgi:chromate transporter